MERWKRGRIGTQPSSPGFPSNRPILAESRTRIPHDRYRHPVGILFVHRTPGIPDHQRLISEFATGGAIFPDRSCAVPLAGATSTPRLLTCIAFPEHRKASPDTPLLHTQTFQIPRFCETIGFNRSLEGEVCPLLDAKCAVSVDFARTRKSLQVGRHFLRVKGVKEGMEMCYFRFPSNGKVLGKRGKDTV